MAMKEGQLHGENSQVFKDAVDKHAYFDWEKTGRTHGHDFDDHLRAKKEVQEQFLNEALAYEEQGRKLTSVIRDVMDNHTFGELAIKRTPEQKQETLEKPGWKGLPRKPFDWETTEGKKKIEEALARQKPQASEQPIERKEIETSTPTEQTTITPLTDAYHSPRVQERIREATEEASQKSKTTAPAEKKFVDRVHVNGRDVKGELKENIKRKFDLDHEPQGVRDATTVIDRVTKEREERLKQEAEQPRKELAVAEGPKKQPSELPAPAKPAETDAAKIARLEEELKAKDEIIANQAKTITALTKSYNDALGQIKTLNDRLDALEKQLNARPAAPASPSQQAPPAAPAPAPTPSTTEPGKGGQTAPTPESTPAVPGPVPDEPKAPTAPKPPASGEVTPPTTEPPAAKDEEVPPAPGAKKDEEATEPKSQDLLDQLEETMGNFVTAMNELEHRQSQDQDLKNKADQAEAGREAEKIRREAAEHEAEALKNELDAIKKYEKEKNKKRGLRERLRIMFNPKKDSQIEQELRSRYWATTMGVLVPALAGAAIMYLTGMALNSHGVILPNPLASENNFPVYPNNSNIIHK